LRALSQELEPFDGGAKAIMDDVYVFGPAHWSITGRFTGPVTGTPPVNFLLADLLPTLLAKKITAPLLACQ